MNRRAFLATSAVALGGVAGCLGRASVGNYDVGMVSDAFVPQSTVEVPSDAPAWVPRDVPTVETTVGDPVVWQNTGARDHTVTAATTEHHRVEELMGTAGSAAHEESPRLPPGGSFFASGGFDGEVSAVESFLHHLNGGGVVPPGERYAHTFDTAGWFHYYCIPHEPAGMMGNVHVLPKA